MKDTIAPYFINPPKTRISKEDIAPIRDDEYKLWLLDKLKEKYSNDFEEILFALVVLWKKNFPKQYLYSYLKGTDRTLDDVVEDMPNVLSALNTLKDKIDEPLLYYGARFGKNPQIIEYSPFKTIK